MIIKKNVNRSTSLKKGKAKLKTSENLAAIEEFRMRELTTYRTGDRDRCKDKLKRIQQWSEIKVSSEQSMVNPKVKTRSTVCPLVCVGPETCCVK